MNRDEIMKAIYDKYPAMMNRLARDERTSVVRENAGSKSSKENLYSRRIYRQLSKELKYEV